MLTWLKKAWTAPAAYPPAPEGTTIYAIGDVHGRADLLESLQARIDADSPVGEAVVEVYLGDYVDRGEDSAGVLSRLVARSTERHAILLKGNHEATLEGFLAGTVSLDAWRRIGGTETLLSYGVPSELLSRGDGGQAAREAFRAALPSAHAMLFRMMRPCHEAGPYLFVHAGIEPDVPLSGQDHDRMMWIREPFLNHTGDFGHVVVHGHTPVREPEMRHNRINIDTGAYVSNRLTCIRIGVDGVSVLEERE